MDENPYTDNRHISHARLVETCKYRQGSCCCRYIFFPRFKNGFYCVKNISKMKEDIDRDVKNMISQGDNCSGLGDMDA